MQRTESFVHNVVTQPLIFNTRVQKSGIEITERKGYWLGVGVFAEKIYRT